jgi:hypothetical protein
VGEAIVKRDKDSQDNERIVIESSFEMSELSDNNEIQFSVFQDNRKALTVNINIDSINALTKRIVSDALRGEMKYREYDGEPEKGGNILRFSIGCDRVAAMLEPSTTVVKSD